VCLNNSQNFAFRRVRGKAFIGNNNNNNNNNNSNNNNNNNNVSGVALRSVIRGFISLLFGVAFIRRGSR